MKLKVGIIGATGYTGIELLRILTKHPQVDITVATSRNYAGKKISDLASSLSELPQAVSNTAEGKQLKKYYEKFLNSVDIVFSEPDIDKMEEKADLFFIALPVNKETEHFVPDLLKRGKRIIDLKGEYRIKSNESFKRWYGMDRRTDPQLVNEVVYGLSEVYRNQIRSSRFIANPGCYATSFSLGIVPLRNIIDRDQVIFVDAVSGISGAGRSEIMKMLDMEDNYKVYKPGRDHKHVPEMEMIVNPTPEENKPIINFTPSIGGWFRGLVSVSHVMMKELISYKDLAEHYHQFYGNSHFVKLNEEGVYPSLKDIYGSNLCFISYKVDKETRSITIISAIDNLGKGAAGQAVQNMNLMSGFPEEEGLKDLMFDINSELFDAALVANGF